MTEIKKEADEVSLKELILKLRALYSYIISKWKVVFIFVIFGCTLGFLYSFLKKKIYTSTTTFALESGDSSGGGLGQYSGLASMVGIDIGGGGGLFQGDNIIELYKSRTMIGKTLLSKVRINGKEQLLINRYLEFNRASKLFTNSDEFNDITFDLNSNAPKTRAQDSILSMVVNAINKKYLSVTKPDKKLSIIKVDVRATDEFFAKEFNEQIVKNVNDFYIKTKTKKSLQNVQILQQKTDSVRSVMNGAIYNAAVATDVTPNLNAVRQTQRVVPVQRSQFTAETNKMVLIELLKNLELSKISLRKETPLIQLIDSPVFPLKKDYVGKFEGIVVGGVLSGFLIVFLLFVRFVLKNIILRE